ncbi:hypothetical protein [Thermodesulfovibrio sp.]|uniref:hypothetical protein n=1 Tax=Thermodesulfovibrio sp. TaxID=2067987 RepID=UPI0030A6B86D
MTEDDVNGEKWNTSVPKLIDNAIIGYKLKNEAQSDQTIPLIKNKSLTEVVPLHHLDRNKNYSLNF